MILHDALNATQEVYVRLPQWPTDQSVRRSYGASFRLYVGPFERGEYQLTEEDRASDQWEPVTRTRLPNSGTYRDGDGGLFHTSSRETGELSVSFTRSLSSEVSRKIDSICEGNGRRVGTHWLIEPTRAESVLAALRLIGTRVR